MLACPVAAARGGLTLLTSNASSLLCRLCTCCSVLASLFGVGMNFCAGVSGWRVAALAGLQEPCWHGGVLGLICSPPRPCGPLLLLFISDPSSPARGRGRCFPLAVSQSSAVPCQNPCTLSPWEESLLGSVFNKFNPRVQTLLLSVGLILRGVSTAIPPRAGA